MAAAVGRLSVLRNCRTVGTMLWPQRLAVSSILILNHYFILCTYSIFRYKRDGFARDQLTGYVLAPQLKFRSEEPKMN